MCAVPFHPMGRSHGIPIEIPFPWTSLSKFHWNSD